MSKKQCNQTQREDRNMVRKEWASSRHHVYINDEILLKKTMRLELNEIQNRVPKN